MSELVLRTDRADSTRTAAAALATVLGAGDLVVLDGPLGAGKTTFTQGLGQGLQVRGPVASPTFVIARVHPSLRDGPALVHVDAYRLGEGAEIDDLDLEAELDDAVTVVEWGRDRVEHLAESSLLVQLERPAQVEDPDDPDEPRTLRLSPHGPRWNQAALEQLTTALAAAGLTVDSAETPGPDEARELGDAPDSHGAPESDAAATPAKEH